MHRSNIYRRSKKSVPLNEVPDDNYTEIVVHPRHSDPSRHSNEIHEAIRDSSSADSLILISSMIDETTPSERESEAELEVSGDIPSDAQNPSFNDILTEKLIKIHLDHRISFQGMDSIIDLVNYACRKKIIASKMKNELQKYNSSLFNYSYRFVCHCGSTIKVVKNESKLPSSVACMHCGSILTREHFFASKFFIDLSIQEQLEWICAKVYKEIKSISGTIDLIAAIDGIPLSNSSSLSLLPILLYVQNLDIRIRSRLPILKTIYVDSTKPNAQHFMGEFVKEVNYLQTNDFQTKFNRKTRIKLLGLLADAPCRAWLLNLSQFNGEYPCHRCLIRIDTSDNVPKFPPIQTSEIIVRTMEDTERIRQMIRTRFVEENVMIRGVKPAETPLKNILNFDYIKQTLCEYQHANPLGLIRFLFRDVFFNQAFNHQVYFIGHRTNEIDACVNQMKLVSSFRRKPRSVSTIKHWKANELENFLFYIAPEALKEILPDPFYSHIIAYAASLHKMLDSKSNCEDVEIVENIDAFIRGSTLLGYPISIYRYNFHLLIHLFEDYKLFGSINEVTAYTYESQLGKYKSTLKNSFGIAQQIATNNSLKLLSFNAECDINHKGSRGIGNARSIPLNSKEEFILAKFGTEHNLQFYDKAVVRGHSISRSVTHNVCDNLVQISNYVFKIRTIFTIDDVVYVSGNRSELSDKLEISISENIPSIKVDYLYHLGTFSSQYSIYPASSIESSMILLKKAGLIARFFTKVT